MPRKYTKKPKVKITKVKIREVKELGPNARLVVADGVEFEMHGAPTPPKEPIPVEIEFNNLVEKVGSWGKWMKSVIHGWTK